MRHWTPQELDEYFSNTQQPLQILDVREPWEYDIAHIEGSTLIPLGKLVQEMDKLNPSQDLLVVCHHGIRSAHACYFLERNGFQTINLTGGIARWAKEIDLDMPLY
ncbi:MAG: rhodanese-like domain-containing protein [Thiothrix sp.]|jgi:rhodanese-related sulfurtransferase|uniref:rhodanese-like domain-containing protein n=1 Tax=Thiothrix sp. TaxID=1032 RepID=UPI0026313A48|nr:rhodanese-like domain-containing protein [Thiothrix sp.]MDD5391628.1 rhodanese-like domain-containing protein [Thiothrix sp.]